MPITGSTQGKSYARLGLMRLGATRLDYYQPWFKVLINGVDRTSATRITGATITQELDAAPDTAEFRVSGITPTKGQDLKFYMGDSDLAHCLFAGRIREVKTGYEGVPTNVYFDLSCIDYTWLLNRRKVMASYTNQSATAILLSIMTAFTTGFTTRNVATGLPTIDDITFVNEDVSDAIDKVMQRIGGAWFMDYTNDLNAFITNPHGFAQPVTQAAPLTTRDITLATDLSQVRTRVWVRGRGASAAADVSAGMTSLPVDDATAFASSGGRVEVGAQRITYTGKSSLEGQGAVTAGLPGVSPAAPGPVEAQNYAGNLGLNGADLPSYRYAVTFVSASGETAPGAQALIQITPFGNPSPPGPTEANNHSGNLAPGNYHYALSAVNANGETAPVFATLGAISRFNIGNAPGTPAAAMVDGTAGNLTPGTFLYAVTFVNANGETTGSATASATITRLTAPSAPSASQTTGGSLTALGVYKYKVTFTDAAGETTGSSETTITLTGSNNAVNLSSIAISSDARTTGRKIYRTVAGGATFKLLTTIGDNSTTTYADTTADGSLGADIPGTNTSGSGRVSVTAIATGPTGTTSRKVYRTVANGSALKLLTTIADNSTTSYADNTADGSLGADAGAGSIGAGAGDTTLKVTDLSKFPSSGWVSGPGSQAISYTGRAASSGEGNLTGIPSSGAGSITASISAGSTVVVLPHLTGIPSSGDGAIATAINRGDRVAVLVRRDDTTAQTNMAGFVGGDGIHEDHLSDDQASETECVARGDAQLTLFKDPIETVTWTTRDQTVRIGRTIQFALTTPAISGTYKIRRVTFSEIAAAGGRNTVFPLRTVDASSRRFSLEELLRQITQRSA